MATDKIIVSKESFESDNHYELIYANINYINKLFKKGVSSDQVPEDALKSYYIDSYLAQVIFAGFTRFTREFKNRPKKLYYIHEGLNAIKAHKNLQLFQDAFNKKNHSHYETKVLDKLFEKLQQEESIVDLHYRWLINHPKLNILPNQEIDHIVQESTQELTKPSRHILLIKKLCQNINEHYLRITAGDPNNPFQSAWYFKTTQRDYYMVEKNGTATMHNSHTKEKVSEIITERGKTKGLIQGLKRSSA